MGCTGTSEPKDKDVVDAPPAAAVSAFKFESGLPDCCTANPEFYKVVAEIPNARLIEMTMKPGDKDKPHEHPPHSLYFLTAAKLKIADPPDAEPKEMEIPQGAPPIFPAGAHMVENTGDAEATVLFVEPYPTCKPCGNPAGFVKPFDVAPKCYTILAENDEWITGQVVMEPGETDEMHHHRDHLIYVVSGNEVTIFPGGDMNHPEPAVVPIKPGAGIPAPMEVPLFAKHAMKNSGTETIKMIFFEMKN